MRATIETIYAFWKSRPLRFRILLPIIVLMVLSLLASAAAFLVGTARTQRQILENELSGDATRVETALLERTELVSTTAGLLSNDPLLIAALAADDLLTVNKRALVIRDRFSLDLVQVFDASGIERANLVTADLYQVSSLLDLTRPGQLDVQEADGRLLLLSRAELAGAGGTIITGMDLGTELERIASQERLPGEIILLSRGGDLAVTSGAASGTKREREDSWLSHEGVLNLGGTQLELAVSRQISDMRQVTGAGFTVMVGSSLLTTVLLLAVGIFITRSITGPVQQLAATAQAVAGGDWSQQQALASLAGEGETGVQTEDEIRLLAQALGVMLAELRSLYTGLEQKVAERTQWLLTAAEVAQAASSSLDLDVVLTSAAQRIHECYGFTEVSIYEVGEAGDSLFLRKTVGDSEPAERSSASYPHGADRSLVGVTAARMSAIIVQDVSASVYCMPEPGKLAGGAAAAFPLVSGETLVGVLAVRSAQQNAFSEEMVSSLKTIADQLTVAIENARLYDAAQREVAERRRAEEAQKASEEQYRLLFEDDLTGDFIARADGSVIACNAAFARIFGFDDVWQASSCRLPSLFASPAEWDELVALVRANGRLEYYETELQADDGRDVNVIANLVGTNDSSGNLIELKGYVFDNTERKRLEDQLRHAQKMEAIGRLAGGVAHDFNNMLTVIVGYSELLGMRNDLDEIARKQISAIHQTGHRAAVLTGHLLAFSRKQVLQPTTLDLNTVVANIESMIQRMIGEDVQLSLCPTEELVAVKADPGQIEQVVMNLVVNARDAMPGGGQLLIETANVELDDAYAQNHVDVQPGHYVMLAVSDTGSGIPAHVMPYIFEPFFTTKEMGQGTGLGLSTVYGILKQSGGHVRVYSEVGQGTTFKIYLPRTDECAASESSAPPEARLVLGGETLLLVEDEEAVRELTASTLRDCGYQVLEAANGVEAIKLAASHPERIEFLITDVVMPNMSGKEVVERLRAQMPDLGVLYISGYSEQAVAQRGILSPGAAFMSKPFSPTVLASRVRELLDANGAGARPRVAAADSSACPREVQRCD